MNDFLENMQSLTLYRHIKKASQASKCSGANNLDEIKLEMVKYKNSLIPKEVVPKIENTSFLNDYSSISEIGNVSTSAMTSTKDILAKSDSFSKVSSGINSTSNNIVTGGTLSKSVSSSLSNYSSSMSGSFGGTTTPKITQFGLVKMTGTEGRLQNGYTLGKEASSRASASLDYITRDENGKAIAEIKDKDGKTISKLEVKQQIENILAERRLVISPNPRLNLDDEQLDRIVRTTMNSYSESFGKEFEYHYAIHNNTATPHAHILMTSTQPDGDGIKTYKDELFELKMNLEDAIKDEIENSNIKIKDNTTMPMAKQIGNFIGAIPDTNIFNQNKFLAHKISKKFDLEYNQKEIGNDPQKLEEWFNKNQSSYKEYFMSAINKEAFLFQEYSQSAMELSSKFDMGLNENTLSDIKEFKNWIDDKKEIFLADRIASDKDLILQKDDIASSKKLYKWFMENEQDVKEWNEEHKNHPSKQMHSLASRYSKMVDNPPDNVLSDRKTAREFVKTYTKDPLSYAGDSRKSLYKVLGYTQEKYNNEFNEDRITPKIYVSESKRLESLQNRLIQGQEISEGSLKKYNINTDLLSKDIKTIEVDGIDLKEDEIRNNVLGKINTHRDLLDKSLESNKIDKEYHTEYSKKAKALSYVVSKAQNISISALENIGLDKEIDLDGFKIEKVPAELQIINFKDSDIQNDFIDILKSQFENKSNPLKHQLQKIEAIEKKIGIKVDENILSDYKEVNKFIDKYENFSIEKIQNSSSQDEITQGNYKEVFENFIELHKDSQGIESSQIDKFYTLVALAIENSDIKMIDELYSINKDIENDHTGLELKFEAYKNVLDIKKEDIYERLLEKHFNFSSSDLEQLDNLESTFKTNLEFNQNDTNIDDLQIQLYTEALTELVNEKYDNHQWEYYNLDDENANEEDFKTYLDGIESLNKSGQALNNLIAVNMEIKALENEIEQNLNRGNFIVAQELMQDERLDDFTKNMFEQTYNNLLSDENILDEVYERVIDGLELDEKVYEIFKDEEYLTEIKKIELEETVENEQSEELEEDLEQDLL